MERQIRFCIFDDHPIVIEGVSSIVSSCADIELVCSGRTADQVAPMAIKCDADVILLDLMMPNSSDTDETTMIQIPNLISAFGGKNIKIIVFSSKIIRQVVRSLIEGGISGYIYKGDNLSLNIPNAIRKVDEGGVYFSESISRVLLSDTSQFELTKRQIEVIEVLVLNPNKSILQISEVMHVTEGAIKKHLTEIYRRLNIEGSNRRQQLASKCKDIGLFSLT